jgi:hypothetical protein
MAGATALLCCQYCSFIPLLRYYLLTALLCGSGRELAGLWLPGVVSAINEKRLP